MSFDENIVIKNDTVIKLESVSKHFQIYEKPHHRLMQGLFRGKRQFFKEFRALDNISFEIKKGETVGIIGRNGAGKSTLLQIICGTMSQSSGSVEVNGRIAALLELGSGFNPEFTGRENVFLNGSILGLKQEEIEERFDEIAAFADIGEFIEQPVKTYSSGMFVRLAFAVNIMSNPEIMVVDEALAVGDMNFQAKCITALTRIQNNGATILFVSHDVGSVKSLCSRGIYLEGGKLKQIGASADVAESYIRKMREEINQVHSNDPEIELKVVNDCTKQEESILPDFLFKNSEAFNKQVAEFRYGSGGAKISFVEILDESGKNIVEANFNQDVWIKIYFQSMLETSISPNFYIMDDKKNLIIGAGPRQLGLPFLSVKPNHKYVVTYQTKLPLQEGNYSIQIQLNKPILEDQTAEFLDVIDDAIIFKVARKASGRVWSKVLLPVTMEVQG